jgi:hypothetical protein
VRPDRPPLGRLAQQAHVVDMWLCRAAAGGGAGGGCAASAGGRPPPPPPPHIMVESPEPRVLAIPPIDGLEAGSCARMVRVMI